MDLGLKNRVAIVTGSSRGIGKAIARGLSKEGAKVAICSRNTAELEKTAEEIKYLTGTEVLPLKVDLKNEGDVKLLVEQTIKKFGRVDVLVNNSGGPPASIFLDTTKDGWRDALDSLLMSVISCCMEVVPYMKKQQWGRIINMASFTAKQPAERLILSNAVRAAVLGLTKTLSNELAEYGILVNAVCPGWTLTRRVEELAKSTAEKTGKAYDLVIAEWANDIPLKRLAQPEEIASQVVFLASEKASYITGTVIQVDGGYIKSLI